MHLASSLSGGLWNITYQQPMTDDYCYLSLYSARSTVLDCSA